MAKKKGKNGNQDAEKADAPEDHQPCVAAEGSEQGAEPVQQHDTPVEDMSVDDLRAELSSARAEIARLNAELAKAQERDIPLKVSKSQDVQELQEKLQRLRKEQQEADAARDKAWKQLKVGAAKQRLCQLCSRHPAGASASCSCMTAMLQGVACRELWYVQC